MALFYQSRYHTAMRLFFAIRIPFEFWKPLTLIQERLPTLPGIRYSLTHDFHLTFKFLGECDSMKALEAEVNVRSTLKRLHLRVEDLELSFSKLNFFQKDGIPQVIWVGVKMSSALYVFQQELESTLELLGFESDGKRFYPHVTLARVREFKDHGALEAWKFLFGKLGVQRKSFTVETLELIESQLELESSPVYETVARFPLS